MFEWTLQNTLCVGMIAALFVFAVLMTIIEVRHSREITRMQNDIRFWRNKALKQEQELKEIKEKQTNSPHRF